MVRVVGLSFCLVYVDESNNQQRTFTPVSKQNDDDDTAEGNVLIILNRGCMHHNQ